MIDHHKNHKWIYTYDYAPDSVWEPWRDSNEEPVWVQAEADAVMDRVAVNAACAEDESGVLTFALLADSHFVHNGTWQDTTASLKALEQRMALDGVIHLGDLSDGLLPLNKTREIENRCIDDMKALGVPVYVAFGNHDYNYFRGNPEVSYPDIPRYSIDYPDQKLRLVFIDSFDPKESIRYGYSEQCINWLEETLSNMPEGYVVIIFSHITPLVQLQAWAKEIRNSDRMMEVLDSYGESILAFVVGHNHCDQIYNDLDNGKFPIISINCAKCEYFLEHKPAGSIVPPRRLGDRTQESFDIMQVDAANKRICFTRFGAGYDRAIENGKGRYDGLKAPKKVITYGIRFKDFDIQRNLFALRNNGDIEIVAEFGYAAEDQEVFFLRKNFEEGIALEHDYIVVQERDRQALNNELAEKGHWDESSKVIDISYLLVPHFDAMNHGQLRILRELMEAPYEDITNRDWLKQKLYAYGFNPFFKLAKDPESGVTWTTCGILQVPEEFVDFCLYLADGRWKGEIREAVEIGVWRGNSSYILAALLCRNNPGMTYNMVDISDNLVHFDEAKEIIPSLRKRIPSTSDNLAGRSFDFCFIDADHSYDGMMRDYMNVGQHTAKILAFHDIYGHEYDHLNGGTVRGWQEIRELESKSKITEYTKYPDFWMGIGVVEKS